MSRHIFTQGPAAPPTRIWHHPEYVQLYNWQLHQHPDAVQDTYIRTAHYVDHYQQAQNRLDREDVYLHAIAMRDAAYDHIGALREQQRQLEQSRRSQRLARTHFLQ